MMGWIIGIGLVIIFWPHIKVNENAKQIGWQINEINPPTQQKIAGTTGGQPSDIPKFILHTPTISNTIM